MAYKYEYAICALLLQSVVTYRFFSRRRFPNIQNRLFEVILIIGIIDIVLDIASSIMIQYTMACPFFFVYIVNTVFYAIQIFFPIFLILYTISIIKDYKIKKQTIFMVSLPGVAFELFLFSNIFHKAIFYVDHYHCIDLTICISGLFIDTACYITCHRDDLFHFAKSL